MLPGLPFDLARGDQRMRVLNEIPMIRGSLNTAAI
jgi:hypothetical protein